MADEHHLKIVIKSLYRLILVKYSRILMNILVLLQTLTKRNLYYENPTL